jgi:Tfp pilus assembly protein PilN
MRAVNLLPRDAERTHPRGERLPLAVAAGGAAAVTALFALLAFSAGGAADERRAELALTQAAIEALPAPEQPSSASGLLAQERADRVAALSTALSSRVAVDRMLRELSYVLPADVWLTGLIANAPKASDASAPPAGSAAGSAGAGGVTIQGAAFSHDSVARVLARLALLPTLDNVRLTASARIQPSTNEGTDQKKTAKKPRALVTFTIEADLRTGGRS